MSGAEGLATGLLVCLPLVMLVPLFVHLLRRLLRIRRVLFGGATAEAECVSVRNVESRVDTVSSHRYHVFAFQAPDGRRIEYVEDAAAAYTQVGYRTVVHFDPADPEGTATIAGRDDLAPVIVPAIAFLAVTFFLGLFVWLAISTLSNG
ncbi:DUF3592 domain-containing protein [Streptomyces sp. NPDC002004]